MLKLAPKKLSYEDIENLSHADLRTEKYNVQSAIITVKEQIENNEEDYYGENYEKLRRKLNHLKRLSIKLDSRLAEFNAIKNISSLNEEDVAKYNKVLRHLELTQLLKPEAKYAIFHQVCHELLDADTCRKLTWETSERLKNLRKQTKINHPKQTELCN